jgi:hypothetical protein
MLRWANDSLTRILVIEPQFYAGIPAIFEAQAHSVDPPFCTPDPTIENKNQN